MTPSLIYIDSCHKGQPGPFVQCDSVCTDDRRTEQYFCMYYHTHARNNIQFDTIRYTRSREGCQSYIHASSYPTAPVVDPSGTIFGIACCVGKHQHVFYCIQTGTSMFNQVSFCPSLYDGRTGKGSRGLERYQTFPYFDILKYSYSPFTFSHISKDNALHLNIC